MKGVLITLAIWLVVINLFALVAANRINTTYDTSYVWIQDSQVVEHTWNPESQRTYWDSVWYLDIAKNGYEYRGENTLSNVVFLPIYPALIAVGGFLLWGHYVLAGWIISILALIGAVIMFMRLLHAFHPKADSYFAIFAMLIFPTAFFFSSIYTEALFFFFSISSIYYVRKKNFLLAGMFGILSSLTRITGVLITIPLVWEYARDNHFRPTAFLKLSFLPLLLPSVGTLAFFTYHYLAYGNFLLFFDIQSSWGRALSFNSDHFIFFSHPSVVNFSLDAIFAIFAIIATIAVWKFVRTSYALYMAAMIAAAIGTGTLMSIGRYVLVLFPIYILAARIENQHARFAWILISTLLLALYTTLFSLGYWAG